jgi:hypothetical protein
VCSEIHQLLFTFAVSWLLGKGVNVLPWFLIFVLLFLLLQRTYWWKTRNWTIARFAGIKSNPSSIARYAATLFEQESGAFYLTPIYWKWEMPCTLQHELPLPPLSATLQAAKWLRRTSVMWAVGSCARAKLALHWSIFILFGCTYMEISASLYVLVFINHSIPKFQFFLSTHL